MPSAILSIGTALPALRLSQRQIAQFMTSVLGLDADAQRRLNLLYDRSGIDTRHTVVTDYARSFGELEFFPNTPGLLPLPGHPARMELYRRHAPELGLAAAQQCLAESPGIGAEQITHLITVSCTGLYAPGLDIELAESLQLRPSVERTAVNFMGCYAAFPALKLADYIVRAQPQARVLIVCIELCTVHFHPRTEDDHLVANALFADGCAAALVGDVSAADGQAALQLDGFYSETVSAGRSDMAWHLGEAGFEIGLSSYVPDLVRGGIAQLFDRLVERVGGRRPEAYAVHPGGVAILRAAQQALGLTAEDVAPSYDVLRQVGNLSSATILFVLREWLRRAQAQPTPLAACAFGPGLTLESLAGTLVR